MKKSQLRSSLLVVSALSVSIASQLQAVVITSTAAGIWEDPASWIGGVFPDTFVADSAVIDHAIVYDDLPVVDGDGGVTTPATPFTLAMGIVPGGLSVLNGNSITINGAGSLAQATLLHEIRIGEGGGAGVGLMSINGGGTFFSGSSVGVGVGTDRSNTGLGNGRLDINEGVFVMENFAGAGLIPAGPAQLGVGIEGSTGTINVGDAIAGAGDAILDLQTNNNTMGIGVTNQLGSAAGTGTVTVNSDGIILLGSGAIVVAAEGGTGTLNIHGRLEGLGTLSPTPLFGDENGIPVGGTILGGNLTVGTDALSVGTLTSDGTVFGVGRFTVGEDGAGTLVNPSKATISGGDFNTQETYIGRNGGVGVIEVTGGIFRTGSAHRGNPDTGAGHESRGLRLGTGTAGSNGALNITGGEVHQVGWLDVGHGTGNTGSLNVSGTGKFIHEEAGANNDSNIGRAGGTGELNITAGGLFQTNFWLNVARDSGSTGSVLVDGAGSLLKFTSTGRVFNIGEQGTGSLDVTTSGKIETAFGVDLDFNVGNGSGSIGTLLVETSGHLAMATDVLNGDIGLRRGARLVVGNNAGSEGMVTIKPTAMVDVRQLVAGQSGKGTVVQDGGTVNVAQWLKIGEGDSGGPTGDDELEADLVTPAPGENKASYVLNDGVINTPELMVGEGRRGQMTVNGGTVNILNGGFGIGRWGPGWNGNGNLHGEGTLTQNGGVITAPVEANLDIPVGVTTGAIGTLNVNAGAHFDMSSDEANGDVGQRNGGRVILGNDIGSQGTLNIGADAPGPIVALVDVRHLTVGQNGKGTVVQDGGVVNVAQWLKIGEGDSGGPTGDDELAPDLVTPAPGENKALYTLNAGVINTPELMVGEARRGEMVVNGGTVNILNGGFGIGRWGPGWNGGANLHGEGTLTQNGGVITAPVEANLDIPVGVTTGAIGTLNVNAGAHFDMSSDEANGDVGQRNGGRVILGNDIGSQGTLNIGADAPGPIVALVDVRHLTVGQNGKGTVVQDGGVVNVAQWLKIGEGDSGGPTGDDELAPDLVTPAPGENKALYTLNDGIVNTPELMIGEGRRGEMRVNGGEVNILNGGFGIGRWGPGWNGGANLHGEGKLAQTGGTINSNGQLTMAETAGGKALYELSGGTLNLGVGANHNLVVGNAGTGTMNVTNSPMINGVNDFIVAPNGGSVGNVNLAFANATDIMRVNAWMYVGGGTGSVGNVTVTKGELLVSGQSRIGYNNGGGGMGTLTVDGSEAKFTGNDETFVGYESGTSNGTIDLKNGGTVNINHWLNVGRNGGTGKVTQDSGIFTVANEARFGVSFNAEAPGTGTLNLSGGTFTASGTTIFGSGGGTGTANITGGILNALSSVIVGGGNGGTSFQITNYATADNVIDGGPEQAFSFTANYTTSNTQDNGDAGGPFGLGVQVANLPAGDNNDFAFVGLGNFAVATTGSYIFGNNTDDGSRLRLSINGGAFTEIITDNVLSGPHDAFSAPIALTLGDTIALDWMWFERGGGAEGETFYSRDGGPNALWQDSSQGLTLNPLGLGGVPVGQYSGTVYKGSFTVVTSNGAVNLNGGVLSTTFIEAGVGLASLKLAGGTLQARQDEPNFIRGFTNSGGHSAILLEGPGGTIDSNGFRVKIAAGGSVFSSVSDVSSIDGQAGAVLTIEGDAILALSDTDKVTLQTQVGDGVNGYLSIRVKEGGWLDSEVSQVLDNITIDNGGYFELSNLSSPPGAPALAADDDLGGGAASLAGSPIQGVPEPGTMGLLLVTALGLLGRPNRRKKS